MNDEWVDVHGAGAQRSDPKSGDASEYPEGNGPQGDAIRIDNYVILVRNLKPLWAFYYVWILIVFTCQWIPVFVEYHLV
jgi:hypothetical protein